MASAADAGGAPAAPPRFSNRLASEQSPYLLQHAHNEVGWAAYPQRASHAHVARACLIAPQPHRRGTPQRAT